MKNTHEKESIDLVFLPPDGGYKTKTRKRERRRFKSYAFRNGQGFIVWESGECWQFTPTESKIDTRFPFIACPDFVVQSIPLERMEITPKPRRYDEAPDIIQVGQHDEDGPLKAISITLQYRVDPAIKDGYKGGFRTVDKTIPNRMIEHYPCIMDRLPPPKKKRIVTAPGKNAMREGGHNRAVIKAPAMRKEILDWFNERRNSGTIRTDKRAYEKTVEHFKSQCSRITVNVVRDIVKGTRRA